MGGLVMIAVVAAVAMAGMVGVRAAERRTGIARREFRRAMQGLATSTLAAGDGGPSYGIGAARPLVRPRGSSALRQRRRIVSLVTIGAACGALGGMAVVPDRLAGAVAALAVILAVGYQLLIEAVRRGRRAD